MALFRWIPAGVVAGALAAGSPADAPPDPPPDAPVDFARDVRPILSDNCYFCHGFDAAQREAGLRLDVLEGATAELDSGHRAVVPGDPDASRLLWRVTHDDRDVRMPPPESEKSLSAAQIDTLRRWIEQGAPWAQHWSFVPPERVEPPTVARADWPLDPLDRFVLARLEQAGLAPSPEAPPETLLRRVSYDLTGLPPTPAELDAFLEQWAADPDAAYAGAVERLLASPRYGEHMARYWLDAARYADTHGLHLDNERTMWRYREWVIEAFNQDMGFDRFTVEQLAGDLLPDPTVEQLVASGFNRCNPTSAEGGMIAEEYLALYAKDRVDTTSTVWMGLTLACAKCHEHKYDPFTQREYYQLFAFFNSLAEEASDRNIANPVPFVRVPSDEERARMEALDERVAQLGAQVEAPLPEVDAAQARWELAATEDLSERWRILVPASARAEHGTQLRVLEDDSVLAFGHNPAREVYEVRAFAGEERITALRLEALVGDGAPERVPGRAHNQNFVLSEVELLAHPPGRPDQAAPVRLSTAVATHSQEGFPITAALDGDAQTGWAGLGSDGPRTAVLVPAEPFGFPDGTELVVRLRHESRFAEHALARFRLAVAEDPALAPVRPGPWSSAGPFVSEDGRAALTRVFPPEEELGAGLDLSSERWTLQPDWADGQVHLLPGDVGALYLARTLEAASERRLRVALGSDDGVRLWLNGELVHENPAARGVALDQDFVDLALRAGSNELLMKVANYGGACGFAFRAVGEEPGGLPLAVSAALSSDPAERSTAERELLRRHYRSRYSPLWAELQAELEAARGERAGFEAALPTTMISRELDERRPAHILVRGQYDRPGEEVRPEVPSALPPLDPDTPRDRLGLARWLVSGHHPLTARVTVNRLWAQVFGAGLVETAEDFGSQGEFPSHPELLDGLALDFVESGWDVKALMRRLVSSTTYRQSARATPELLAVDPYNRLLARGPRFRLDAEALRDTALYLSGLLVERVGGPSVKPYQPPGVWKAVGYTSSNTANFRQDTGEALYRRSLYTFWKRTAPPPNMAAFDAPSREACVVRRARTNTPMQALVLLNDPQWVEAARHFAARVLREGGADDGARLRFAFRWLTARRPTADELAVLRAALDEQRAAYRGRADDARALLEVGDSPREGALDPVEHAAWTNVATLLFNLDEAVTRG